MDFVCKILVYEKCYNNLFIEPRNIIEIIVTSTRNMA